MPELVKRHVLKKLVTVGVDKCTENVEFEKICAEVEAAFQDDAADPNWFLHSEDVKEVIIKAVTSVVQKTRLPQSLANENEDDCFTETASLTTGVCSAIATILTNLHKGQSSLDDADERKEGAQQLVRDVVSAVAPQCLVLKATHCEKWSWTSNKSRKASEGLGAVLCKMSDCDSVPVLLMEGPAWSRGSHDRGFFGDVIGILKERLTRDEWHKEPGTRQAFRWCLLQMKHPYLGDHLDSILPPSLLFTDDYKMTNKLLGIECLLHIIDNVDPTELRLYGRAVVIYEALHHQLYTQKPALIGQLLPCLIRILAVTERSPHKGDEERKPNRYDTVLQTLLTSMEFEQNLALRQTYARNLHLFIDSMGITILRHMKRVVRVIVKYLEACDGHDDVSRMYTLQSLHSIILQAWPRIPNHWEVIIKVLLKLLCNACDNSIQIDKEVRQSITDGCVDCLVLLKRCCRNITKDALNDILTLDTAKDAMKQCVQRVLAS